MFGELKVQLRNESYEQLRTGFTSSSPFSAKKDKTRERKTFVVCLFICSFFGGGELLSLVQCFNLDHCQNLLRHCGRGK